MTPHPQEKWSNMTVKTSRAISSSALQYLFPDRGTTPSYRSHHARLLNGRDFLPPFNSPRKGMQTPAPILLIEQNQPPSSFPPFRLALMSHFDRVNKKKKQHDRQASFAQRHANTRHQTRSDDKVNTTSPAPFPISPHSHLVSLFKHPTSKRTRTPLKTSRAT